jgi:hypothetical protein
LPSVSLQPLQQRLLLLQAVASPRLHAVASVAAVAPSVCVHTHKHTNTHTHTHMCVCVCVCVCDTSAG